MPTYRWKVQSTTPGDYRWTDAALALITGAAQAEQLASDVAAVEAKKGHLDDDYSILGVAGTLDLENLLPANIRRGVTIGGVTGSYAGPWSDLPTDTAPQLETAIRSVLKSLPAVTAIVGEGDAARIRPDVLDEDDVLPAIGIEVRADEERNALDESDDAGRADVAVICRATTRRASRELANAARTNNTTPSSGLAGWEGIAGGLTLSLIFDSQETGFTEADDASGTGWYDTEILFVALYERP
jgi:hypothetical protein